MKKKRRGCVGGIIAAALLLIASVAFLCVALTVPPENNFKNVCYFFAMLFGVLFLVCFISLVIAIVHLSKQRKMLKEPSSVAHKVMGEGTEFSYFEVRTYNPTNSYETKKSVIANIIGAVSYLLFGAGIFRFSVSAREQLDVFISDTELVIGGAYNPDYKKEKFMQFSCDDVEEVAFIPEKNDVRLSIKLAYNRGDFSVIILCRNFGMSRVRETFSKFTAAVTAARKLRTDSFFNCSN